MSDIDNMTNEQLETALQEEIANLGQNQDIDNTSEEAEQNNDEVTDEGGTDDGNSEADEWDEWVNEEQNQSKSEKKIKKLLSQRNKERSEKAELEERVKQLEKTNADTTFYNSNPWAEKYKAEIDEKMSANDKLTRQEAYLIVAGESLLADKTGKAWARKITGNTPWNITTPKKASDMTTAELDAQVRELEKSWKLVL